MDDQKKVFLVQTFSIQLIRDLLIEQGITTHDKFHSLLKERINAFEHFSDEEKEALTENL